MRIEFGFSTGKHSLISWLIRRATGSKVSHAFLIYRDETLADDLMLEADRGGFQIDRLATFLRTNTLVTRVPLDIPAAAIQAADRWIGEGYDYAGLVGEAIVKMARWCGKKISSPLHDPKALFCSEAMVRLLQVAQYPGADALVPYDVSPQDLLAFLQLPRFVAPKQDPSAPDGLRFE